MKIRAYLALMVAAILVPVILFSTISLNMLLKAEREAALKGVRETARISQVSIDRELTNAISALLVLSRSHYLTNGELAGFYEQAQFIDKPGVSWTSLLDENGQQLLNTAVPFGTPMPPAVALERVDKALAAGVPQVSNLIRGAVTQALLVVVDVPLVTPSGKRYVVAQGFRIEYFNRVLNQANLSPSWVTGVFDRNGITIAQNNNPKGTSRAEARQDLRDAIRRETVGVIRNASEGDVSLYTVLERSALSGWTVAVGVPEAEIESAARRALTVAALGLLACVACAALAALFFVRRLSRSIRAAAQSAHALERGEVPTATPRYGVIEVEEVQAAIVSAAAVIASEKQSRQAAEAEREQLFASEHTARTMAERQNRAKDEFLAMLGHELRNPLSAIVNAAGVMAHPGMPATSVENSRAIIGRQSLHLTRIVEDLLDVGRVHSGKVLLERLPVRLDLLAQGCVATLAQTGRSSGHEIGVDVAPAWVNADPTRLEQIIGNLLDNAIKYTPEGGSIAVTVRCDGDAVALAVSDTGIGITPDLMTDMFELFVQGERTLERAQGGLGVGLALVRRLASMHGGSIEAHSAGAGKGSSFVLRLPRVEPPGPAIAMPAAPKSSGQHVLLIEDNEDGRDTMTMMLESHEYQVTQAADGSEGLRLAAVARPDIALVDIGLPGIDGYEVARRMRADPGLAQIRLVALTGYGQDSDQQRAIEAGFDAHLVKPVEMKRLMEVLEAHVARR